MRAEWRFAWGAKLVAGITVSLLLQLLEGDANVLFFLDADRRPMVGHAEFSYTLNRRE